MGIRAESQLMLPWVELVSGEVIFNFFFPLHFQVGKCLEIVVDAPEVLRPCCEQC